MKPLTKWMQNRASLNYPEVPWYVTAYFKFIRPWYDKDFSKVRFDPINRLSNKSDWKVKKRSWDK